MQELEIGRQEAEERAKEADSGRQEADSGRQEAEGIGPRLPTEELRNQNKGDKNTVRILSLHRIRDSADVLPTLVSPWILAVAPFHVSRSAVLPEFSSASLLASDLGPLSESQHFHAGRGPWSQATSLSASLVTPTASWYIPTLTRTHSLLTPPEDHSYIPQQTLLNLHMCINMIIAL